jgi:hypothetical protein
MHKGGVRSAIWLMGRDPGAQHRHQPCKNSLAQVGRVPRCETSYRDAVARAPELAARVASRGASASFAAWSGRATWGLVAKTNYRDATARAPGLAARVEALARRMEVRPRAGDVARRPGGGV